MLNNLLANIKKWSKEQEKLISQIGFDQACAAFDGLLMVQVTAAIL